MMKNEDEKLSYDIWEKEYRCPHCGSEDIEMNGEIIDDEYQEYYGCCDCERVSAYEILTPEERQIDEEIADALWEELFPGEQ